MTVAARTLPRPPRWLIRFLLKPGNWLPAAVWLCLVVLQAADAIAEPSVSAFGLVLINSTACVLFLTRRDASRVGSTFEGAIAVAGTFVVSLLLVASRQGSATLSGAPLIPTVIQGVGIAGWAISMVVLGRSLGIAPADRGLVLRGPYRFIRHPLYAFEALFFLGWLVHVFTAWNAVIIGVWCAIQVTRITREERIIGGYGAYRQTVRWRIIPGVW